MSSIPRHAESNPHLTARISVLAILTAHPHVVTAETEMVRSEQQRRADWYATQAAKAKERLTIATDTNWIPRVTPAVAR